MESASDATTTTVTVLEKSRMSPSTFPPQTHTNTTTFPLTYFDFYWFGTPPVERLFFYSIPSSSPSDFFYSKILPTLKLSLSVSLSYFYPLASSLTWPSNSPNPFLLCHSSSSSGVSLTVAESTADFNHLASDQIRISQESHPYIPLLPSSDSESDVISLQITLFPNQGFSIGFSNHHAVIDGKSATLFIKAWAYLSNAAVASSSLLLPEELIPFLDRSIVHDPEGLDRAFLEFWTGMGKPDPRSLKLAPSFISSNSPDNVRSTFLLSQERIQMLRERVAMINGKKIRLSSFALTFAHSVVCLVKAKQLGIGKDADRKLVHFGFTADARGRVKPPLPANYLGNCVIGLHELIEIQPLIKEEEKEAGIGFVLKRISRMIDEVEENAVIENDNLSKFMRNLEASKGVFIGIAGSPRFHVYGADFGWGRPKSVEVTSIDRTGAISLTECRNGSRGIEVGLALRCDEMELFRSAFAA
ncbi:Malonyl-CoA:anthocyanidin 5-O-glucoside-6''-O-malonyltransferase [Linum perenne]